MVSCTMLSSNIKHTHTINVTHTRNPRKEKIVKDSSFKICTAVNKINIGKKSLL